MAAAAAAAAEEEYEEGVMGVVDIGRDGAEGPFGGRREGEKRDGIVEIFFDGGRWVDSPAAAFNLRVGKGFLHLFSYALFTSHSSLLHSSLLCSYYIYIGLPFFNLRLSCWLTFFNQGLQFRVFFIYYNITIYFKIFH